MRWVFLSVIVLLFELFTYGAGRGLQWWAGAWLTDKSARYLLISLFVISNALLIFGMARLSSIGLKISMTWLTILWFFIMSVIAVGIISMLLTKIAPQFAGSMWYQSYGVKILLPLWFFGMLLMGIYNAYVPTVRHLRIESNQPMTKPLRIAVASDLHLGRFVGNRELGLLKNIVTDQQADVLLMPGDILDDNTDYYQQLKMQSAMQAIVQALPLGVYASLGNHDMYGNELQIRQALQQAGVKVLADEHINVNNQFWLVGRLDNHARHRKATAELMPSVINQPVILLDHEPNDIESNVQLPIDLQLSGHTHNGQIFPANFIVKIFNRLAYGHERINQTEVVVSSGFGFWGVPFRLGSQAEVWIIDLVNKK